MDEVFCFLPLFALVRLSFPEASLRCLHEYEVVGGVNSLDWEIGNEGAKKHALLGEMYCTLGFMIVEPRD